LINSVELDGNMAIGYNSLSNLTLGSDNIAIGFNSLLSKTSGADNIGVGTRSLQKNITGSNNISIGRQAGQNSTGSGNIFIGYRAGQNELGSNKLYIENTNSSTPLIWGDFNTDSLVINGSERVTGNISYVGTLTDVSDKRLKENIKPISNVLQSTLKINSYSYNLIGDNLKELEYGLIAQEVQELFPDIVKTVNKEKGYLGVSYVQLVPILIQALKEQQQLIDSQNHQISESEKRLKIISARIDKLRN
jgi:hypothetical protein